MELNRMQSSGVRTVFCCYLLDHTRIVSHDLGLGLSLIDLRTIFFSINIFSMAITSPTID